MPIRINKQQIEFRGWHAALFASGSNESGGSPGHKPSERRQSSDYLLALRKPGKMAPLSLVELSILVVIAFLVISAAIRFVRNGFGK